MHTRPLFPNGSSMIVCRSLWYDDALDDVLGREVFSWRERLATVSPGNVDRFERRIGEIVGGRGGRMFVGD